MRLYSSVLVWLATAPWLLSLANDEPKSYAVFPVEGITDVERKQVEHAINGTVGPENWVPVTSRGEIVFWRVTATEGEATVVKRTNRVESVGLDERIYGNLLRDSSQSAANESGTEDVDATHQFLAPRDLKLISFPPGRTLPSPSSIFWKGTPYTYDVSRGRVAPMYIVGTGLDPKQKDLSKLPSLKWIYTSDAVHQETDDEEDQYGTCIASKAVGKKNGVARKTGVVAVKIQETVASLFEAFVRIYESVVESGGPYGSVVLCPWTSVRSFPSGTWRDPPIMWKRFRIILEKLTAQGVIVVFAAGNNYRTETSLVDGFPAQFGEDPQLPIIVVGGATQVGERSFGSLQLEQQTTFWAPGDKIVCSAKGVPKEFKTVQGTAAAAALVAGLVSYFLDLPTPPWEISASRIEQVFTAKRYISQHASRAYTGRDVGPLRVIWNLQAVAGSSSNETTDDTAPIESAPIIQPLGNLTA